MLDEIQFPRDLIVGIGAAVITWLIWKRYRASQSKERVEITKITKLRNSLNDESGSSQGVDYNHTYKADSTVNGNDNPAYQEDDTTEKITSKSLGDKVVSEQPRFTPALAYQRQVSDGSNFSDFPPPSGMGLTEMVMEEIERSFSNEHTVRELERSFHGTKTDVEVAASEEKCSISPQMDETEAVSRDSKGNRSLPDEDDVISGSAEEFQKASPLESKDAPTISKEQEWRNRLIEDLNDDEEYLSSSEDEESEVIDMCNEAAIVTQNHSTPDADNEHNAVENNTKCTNGLARGNSVSSGTTKCGGVPIVLDMGSYEIKAGVAGEYEPSHVFRNVLGKWRPQVGEAYSDAYGDILYAEDAITKHNALSLHYPLQDGVVTDWKDFQSICDWTLCNRLGVDIKEHPLLITEPALVSNSQREKELEILMEALHCPMIQFRQQAVLSALYAGADVALVVNSGHACTEIVPVYEGYAITNGIQRVRVGGQHITEYLGRLLLREQGINFSSVADQLLLESVKRSYAEIRSDEYSPDTSSKKTIQHELPDGGILDLGSEVYKCTEPLYSPQLLGHDGPGLYEAVTGSIKKLDSDIRGDMRATVLLTGGNSQLKGYKKCLSDKLANGETTKSISEEKNKSWHVSKCDNTVNSAWIGGSVHASSDDFRDCCVSDDMYFEYGPSIIHRICF